MRSSSIGYCLQLQQFSILVWSPTIKFQIWGRSDQWYLRYSTFRRPLEFILNYTNLQFWFGPIRLSFKYEEDPTSGYWDIPLLIFWGRLPLEVVFIYSNFQIWFGPLRLNFKYEEHPTKRCWDIRLLICWGPLPMEGLFISAIFNVGLVLELKFKIWGRSEKWLQRSV